MQWRRWSSVRFWRSRLRCWRESPKDCSSASAPTRNLGRRSSRWPVALRASARRTASPPSNSLQIKSSSTSAWSSTMLFARPRSRQQLLNLNAVSARPIRRSRPYLSNLRPPKKCESDWRRAESASRPMGNSSSRLLKAGGLHGRLEGVHISLRRLPRLNFGVELPLGGRLLGGERRIALDVACALGELRLRLGRLGGHP